MLFLLALLLTLVYALLLLHFIRGAIRLGRGLGVAPTPHGQKSDHLPSVTVVVPMRNECLHAPRILQALALQDYPAKWEAICVNDRSEDNTATLLEDFAQGDARFRVLTVPTDAPPREIAQEARSSLGFWPSTRRNSHDHRCRLPSRPRLDFGLG